MKLSILIPVYNERTVVERSISLVLAAPIQESIERELVIVDDCSTDGTWDILQRLASEDSRIILLRNEHNSGKGASVRKAIAHKEPRNAAFTHAARATMVSPRVRTVPSADTNRSHRTSKSKS